MGFFLGIIRSRRVQQFFVLAVAVGLVVWRWDDLISAFGAGLALLLLVVLFLIWMVRQRRFSLLWQRWNQLLGAIVLAAAVCTWA